MEDDRYQYGELVDFLMEKPDKDWMRWVGAFVMRTLETGGSCRYRHDSDRLGDACFVNKATDALSTAMKVLPEFDRAFFLRVLLLVPWEQNTRYTGLRMRVGKVIEVLSGSVELQELSAAASAVVESGVDYVKEFPTDDLLVHERRSGTEIVLELSEKDRRKIGVSSRRVIFDRVEVAVSNYRPHGWESNLRVIIPWWLDGIEDEQAGRAVKKLFTGARRGYDDDAGKYRLLGLLDWMTSHPDHQLAPDVLGLGIKGKGGDVRKTAAALALALGRTDVLEKLRRDDLDKWVRNRAEKLLGDATEPRLL
jgi:hypothetical protein